MPKPGNIVVDGGANIGEFAIPAAKLVGEGGKVIAFEPNSEAVSLLRSNAEINGLKNLTIMPKAICDKDGLVKIYTNPVSNVSDGIVPFGESFGRPFDKDSPANYLTKSVKLDTVLCSEKKINLIKLDIEGAEYLALLGTRRILKKKPRIIVELHSEPLRKLVLSHLKQLGYYVVHEVPFSKSVSVAYLEVSSK